jgi:hypothetical protein
MMAKIDLEFSQIDCVAFPAFTRAHRRHRAIVHPPTFSRAV